MNNIFLDIIDTSRFYIPPLNLKISLGIILLAVKLDFIMLFKIHQHLNLKFDVQL